LLTGLVSLRRIRKLRDPRAKSKALAWTAVVLGGLFSMICWIAPIVALGWLAVSGKFGA
jgi:hypothetical protein